MKLSYILRLLSQDKSLSEISDETGVSFDLLNEKVLELADRLDSKNFIEKSKIISKVNNNKTVDTIKVYTDGAVSGNPGEGGIGCVVYDAAGNELAAVNEYIGHATNNIAEYKALLLGLKIALEFKPLNIEFYADSELVVKQVKGEYKVSNPELKNYCQEFLNQIKNIPNYSITHVRREFNKVADKLAILAKKQEIIDRRN